MQNSQFTNGVSVHKSSITKTNLHLQQTQILATAPISQNSWIFEEYGLGEAFTHLESFFCDCKELLYSPCNPGPLAPCNPGPLAPKFFIIISKHCFG